MALLVEEDGEEVDAGGGVAGACGEGDATGGEFLIHGWGRINEPATSCGIVVDGDDAPFGGAEDIGCTTEVGDLVGGVREGGPLLGGDAGVDPALGGGVGDGGDFRVCEGDGGDALARRGGFREGGGVGGGFGGGGDGGRFGSASGAGAAWATGAGAGASWAAGAAAGSGAGSGAGAGEPEKRMRGSRVSMVRGRRGASSGVGRKPGERRSVTRLMMD